MGNKDKKPMVVRLKGDFTVMPDVSLNAAMQIVAQAKQTLAKLGGGDLKVSVLRAEYEA